MGTPLDGVWKYFYFSVTFIAAAGIGFVCLLALQRIVGWFGMPQESYIREKFTREHDAARRLARLYFEKFPKDLYLTEIESWRHLQLQNYEFIFKRLREPIGD
jgi:hypothetical protein